MELPVDKYVEFKLRYTRKKLSPIKNNFQPELIILYVCSYKLNLISITNIKHVSSRKSPQDLLMKTRCENAKRDVCTTHVGHMSVEHLTMRVGIYTWKKFSFS